VLRQLDLHANRSNAGVHPLNDPVYLCCFCWWNGSRAQSCSVTLAPIPTAAQILSIQQERTLGDIEAEWEETDYHVAQNEKFAAHLNAIAGRVLLGSSRRRESYQ
jgi:hypothetical protein